MQVLDDQLEIIDNSSVWAQDVTWKTFRKQWMTETDGERELGKSVRATRHDDDEINTWSGLRLGLGDSFVYKNLIKIV